MNKYVIIFLSLLLLVLPLGGCGSNAEDNPLRASKVAPTKADPEGAVKEIYAEVTIDDVNMLLIEDVEEQFDISMEDLDDFCVVTTSGRFGLADTAILKPAQGKRDALREALYQYRDRRIKEFEKYDVRNSTSISQNAVIYGQGEYLIMLMLEDNDAAKDIIDKYIPRK